MTKGNFVAYYRVSTQRQGKSGLGLSDQRNVVGDYLNGGSGSLVGEFTEVESGRKKGRPQLRLALAQCRKQKAVLAIAKLDRLARNVLFISTLLESNVRFVAVDMPEADTAFLQMAAVFAEWEAKKIGERTKAALAQSKKLGRKLGFSNPALSAHQRSASENGAAKTSDNAKLFASNVLPIINDIRKAGILTMDGIASALNARGVQSARGGQWYGTTVKNVFAYQEA
jgi:DNA invertase Pin-like site-specific DNA recombinase